MLIHDKMFQCLCSDTGVPLHDHRVGPSWEEPMLKRVGKGVCVFGTIASETSFQPSNTAVVHLRPKFGTSVGLLVTTLVMMSR